MNCLNVLLNWMNPGKKYLQYENIFLIIEEMSANETDGIPSICVLFLL